MSSRQIRRLQQLVLASTEADEVGRVSGDDDDGEDSDTHKDGDDDNVWPTMAVSGARARRRGGRRGAQQASSSSPPPSSSSATAATRQSAAHEKKGEAGDDDTRNEHTRAAHDSPAGSRSDKHDTRSREVERSRAAAAAAAAAKQRRRAKKAEDDALLEAVLTQQQQQQQHGQQQQRQRQQRRQHKAHDTHTTDDTAASHTTQTQEQQRRSADDNTNDNNNDDDDDDSVLAGDVLTLLLACDVEQLNTRLERIRAFGVAAVEDVGDGLVPPRRPDGGKRDNGSTSLFPEHHLRLSFRASALATPNRYRWPPYDDHDMRLERTTATAVAGRASATAPAAPAAASSAPSTAPAVYVLHGDSQACRVADLLLLQCMRYGHSLDALLHCLSACNVYHVPVLVACYEALCAVGETHKACEMVDCALYHVGVLLARWPWCGDWTRRQLPLRLGCNAHIFATLRLGVRVAHQRGCARTAYEMSRLLLSLDAHDPCRVLRLLDYAALRARRWWWLVQLHHALVRTAARGDNNNSNNNSSSSSNEDNSHEAGVVRMSRRLLQMPSYAFAAALAMYQLECEATRVHAAATTTTAAVPRRGGAVYKPSRVWRELTASQRAWVQRCATASSSSSRAARMLADAMLSFPMAAVQLVEVLGGATALCTRAAATAASAHDTRSSSSTTMTTATLATSSSSVLDEAAWSRVRDTAARMHTHASLYAVSVQSQLAQQYVALHADLWKTTEATALLAAVLTLRRHDNNDSGDNKDGDEATRNTATSVLEACARRRRHTPLFCLDDARHASTGADAVAASDVEWLALYARAQRDGDDNRGSGGSADVESMAVATAIAPLTLTHTAATLAAAAAVAGGEDEDDEDDDNAQWADVADVAGDNNNDDDEDDTIPEHVLRALDID